MSKRKPYRYLLYLLLLFFEWLATNMPRRFMLRFADLAGCIVWRILSKEKTKVLRHLSFAFKDEKQDEELGRIGSLVFPNLAKTAVDALRIPRFKRSLPASLALVQDEGVIDKIKRVREQGKGVICLTAHIGNWEMIHFYCTARGHGGVVIGRRIYYEPFNRVLEKIRTESGVKVFYRDGSPKPILRALRDNQVIGILADQDVDSVEGVFVPFFGEMAYTPSAPARIAMASGAPLLPAFMVREGEKYRFFSYDLIWPEKAGSSESQAVELTERWSRAVESAIRQYPEQWVWMHERWKTKPGNLKKS